MQIRQLTALTRRTQAESGSAGGEADTIIEARPARVPGSRPSPPGAASLDEYYDAYAARLYGLAVRLLPDDRGTAEEIVVEAFLSIRESESGAAAGEITDLEYMLLRRIRKRSLDARRGRQDATGGGEAQRLPPHRDALATGDGAAPTSQTVRDALATLSREQRESIEQAFFAGRSASEIAEDLGIPKGAVHHAMRSGLRLFGDRLSANRSEAAADSSGQNMPGTPA